jgi:hypothetical protein
MTDEIVSIHDLFAAVRAHPDYVFGTIFVTDDVPPEKLEVVRKAAKWGEEAIVESGFEYIEYVDLVIF